MKDMQNKYDLMSLYFQHIPDMIFKIDKHLVIQDYQASDITYASSPKERFLYQKLDNILPHNVVKIYLETVTRTTALMRPTRFEYDMILPDGNHHYECQLMILNEDQDVMVILHDITQRFYMLQELKESEIRFKNLLENAPFPVVITRIRDGVFLYANKRAKSQLNFNEDRLFGLLSKQYYCIPSDRDKMLGILMDKGEIYDFEVRLYDYKKTPFWALISASVVNYEKETCILAAINDIDSRVKTEQKLSNQFLRLQSHTEIILKISSMDSRINGDVIQCADDITKLLVDALKYQEVAVCLFESNHTALNCISCYQHKKHTHQTHVVDDESKINQYHQSLLHNRYKDNMIQLKSQNSRSIACRINSDDGIIGFLHISHKNEHYTWEPDEITFLCSVADQLGTAFMNRDLLQAHQALIKSEDLLTKAQEVSKTGHWSMDIQNKRLSWSKEMYRIFEIDSSIPITVELFQSKIFPEDRPIVLSKWKAALKGKPYVLQHRIQTDQGIKWIEVKANFDFEDQTAITAMGTSQDITEKKSILQELESYQVHLEEMISMRTSDLEAALQSAESANRAKSAFLSNMSHEIRTPLNAVLGFAHLLRHDPLTAKQNDQLTKLIDSANHLLQIINDILDISKIEANKMNLSIHEFEPSRVIDHICGIVSNTVVKKDLKLYVDLDHIPLRLLGDGNRLSQILLNLVNNAVKFTEKGEISIIARIITATRNSVVLSFEIVDTGIGMSQDQIDLLFNDFIQADDSITRKYGGTGLGLSISKKLVELMGGDIFVRSTLGEGSSFKITLPFNIPVSFSEILDMPIISNIRILILDHDEQNHLLYKNILSNIHVDFDIIKTPLMALEKLRKPDPDKLPYNLIFIDIDSGLRELQYLASHIDELNIPKLPRIILATLNTELRVNDIQLPNNALKEIKIDKIIYKPLTPSRVHDEVIELINRASGYEEPVLFSDYETDLALRKHSKLLLVEDSKINQEVATQLLEAVGMHVTVADNGDIAVHEVDQRDYDLILMDIHMPVMDGYQATELIRQKTKNRLLPIVAMTADAFEEDRIRAIRAGMNDHLSKPVKPDALYKCLVRWLKPTSNRDDVRDMDVITPQPELTEFKLELFDQLIGLDYEKGLNTLLGDKNLYQKLIKQFTEEISRDAIKINEYIKENDYDSLRDLVHTLKGTSGNLGAVKIHHSSSTLYEHLRNHADDVTIKSRSIELVSDIYSLKTELYPLTKKITAEQDLTLNKKQLLTILNELKQLIMESNTQANILFDQYKDALRTAYGEDVFKIETYLNDYTYDQALEIVHQLIKNS